MAIYSNSTNFVGGKAHPIVAYPGGEISALDSIRNPGNRPKEPYANCELNATSRPKAAPFSTKVIDGSPNAQETNFRSPRNIWTAVSMAAL
jgi:hypothetical protein